MITPRYTREIPQRYHLEAGKCTECNFIAFPPRLICPECGSREFEQISLSPSGKIVTYTVVCVAAEEFSTETPLPIAIIETDEGARLTAQVVDCDPEEVEIGKRVRLIFRCIQKEGLAGIRQYGYKAVLEG